jgi:hypothetical protein
MDWFGYSPADLVPFSRDAWVALLADYNERTMPMPVAGLLVGAGLLWLVVPPSPGRVRVSLALLALCWLWIAYAFMHRALGTLLWAADWLAWACVLQAALLLAAAVLPSRSDGLVRPPPTDKPWLSASGGLLFFAVVLWPIVEIQLQSALHVEFPVSSGVSEGRDWPAFSVFGTAPDPTAFGTLAVASLFSGRRALLLLPIPILWLSISASMLGVLGDPIAWFVLAALVASLVAFLVLRRRNSHD